MDSLNELLQKVISERDDIKAVLLDNIKKYGEGGNWYINESVIDTPIYRFLYAKNDNIDKWNLVDNVLNELRVTNYNELTACLNTLHRYPYQIVYQDWLRLSIAIDILAKQEFNEVPKYTFLDKKYTNESLILDIFKIIKKHVDILQRGYQTILDDYTARIN